MDSLLVQILVAYLVTIAVIVSMTLAFWKYLPRLARHAAGTVIVTCVAIVVFSITLVFPL